MGGRGSFVKSGGFSAPAKWQTVDYVDGLKVLSPKNPRASNSLPERANTPGTTYLSYNRDGTFKQLITFDNSRMPIYEIDYGQHQGVKSLHVHFYENGNRQNNPLVLDKGDKLYEKYKKFFKGVKLC